MHTHTTNRKLATVAATLLIIASAGMGCLFAFRVGLEHSFTFALLSVACALGLEIAKPFSLAAGFQFFAQWKPIRGALLVLLALCAVLFSLSAELALISSSRGDLSSKRAAENSTAMSKNEQYRAALNELTQIKTARSSAEIVADINKHTIQYSADCRRPKSQRERWVCTKIESFKAELARTQRREALEAIVANYVGAPAAQERVADPLSTAVVTYFGAVGFKFEPKDVSQWLYLIPVLALEIASTLSILLVNAFSQAQEPITVPQQTFNGSLPVQLEPSTSQLSIKDQVALKMMAHLLSQGGSAFGAERDLAAQIGADRNTLRRALGHLGSQGLIEYKPSKRGTAIALKG